MVCLSKYLFKTYNYLSIFLKCRMICQSKKMMILRVIREMVCLIVQGIYFIYSYQRLVVSFQVKDLVEIRSGGQNY